MNSKYTSTDSSASSIMSPNNSNLNTPASNTINANATGSMVGDWRDDIEKGKVEIRNSKEN